MSTKPSFFPRLGLSRGDGPILPLHSRMSPPIRKKPSEYDLSDLSPRSDHAILSPEPMNDHKARYSPRRSPSPPARYSDRASHAGSASKSRPPQRILFAGPPPPIAASQMFYRDEEDRDTSPSPQGLEASSFARNINSVLFDRNSSSPNRTRHRDYDHHKPDATWLNLQRRERSLQQDLQHLLDAQSTGLAATLHSGGPPPSSTPSEAAASAAASDAGTRSITPTGTAASTTTTAYSDSSPTRRRRVAFNDTPRNTTTTTTSSGTLVPVRQPRTKPLGLRAARTGLARTMALLADLKAEEDAQLTSALGARKQALAQLRRWTARRAGIAEELGGLEADGDEPLGRELRDLETEREVVGGEIVELEARLVGLRRRRKWLDGRVDEVRNRREAGLSGYRGALREVEGRISGLLTRPVIKPLDGEFFSASMGVEGGDQGDEAGVVRESPGGVEFLRLRPERRTAEMAREWWEAEVVILERRKVDVDKERAALEEGVEVWKGAVKLVSEFEAGLRSEMKGGGETGETSNGKGKEREGGSTSPPTPEQSMYAQLDKMAAVMEGLAERQHVAEEKGWNLLICAIGAELEAFRQAQEMLREALRAAGFDLGPDDHGKQGDSTPYLGRSTSLGDSSRRLDKAEPSGGGRLVDLQEGPDEDRELESDNEVPPDLLVAAEEEPDLASPTLSREDSENEVPIEFLREHSHDGEYPGFGVMT
ncbi:hypothetical protein C8A00DRAFT_33255 [Chaetomidium leptoderma]|uniref:Autophagy-related protein 28 n=1 Tax=Chaetomidium leptoderma TaxID=669021 RepID=A0AAN6VNG9_9PEZI|nr:hypothetical protein C8A00DRAFT_33255 [Chaetomidium leptoderma]